MLDQGIGMGYVPSAVASPGEKITIDVRGNERHAHRPEAHLQARGALNMAAAESYPDDLRYHPAHDWARVEEDEAILGTYVVRAGLSRRARSLRAPGRRCDAGQGVRVRRGRVGQGSIDLISPLSGEVVEVNQKAVDEPEVVNETLFEGWLVRIRMSDPTELDGLLDANAYQQLLEASMQPAL